MDCEPDQEHGFIMLLPQPGCEPGCGVRVPGPVPACRPGMAVVGGVGDEQLEVRLFRLPPALLELEGVMYFREVLA